MMVVVTKKCYFSNISKFLLFDFYSSMSKGIVFYQVKRDHGVFDPKKIDFSTLTLPSLVKNSEAKSK